MLGLQPPLSYSQVSYLSSAPWPGGVLHSHISLPHAGGPVNSRGDTAWGSPRDSVLPVSKPHTSVGSPGKKPQTWVVLWLWRCWSYRPSLCSVGQPCSWPNPIASTLGQKIAGICWQLSVVPLLGSQLPGKPGGPEALVIFLRSGKYVTYSLCSRAGPYLPPSPLCTFPLDHLISRLASSLFPNPPSAPSGSLPLSEGPSLGPVPSWAGVEFPVSHQEAPPLPSPQPASSGPSQGGGGAAC